MAITRRSSRLETWPHLPDSHDSRHIHAAVRIGGGDFMTVALGGGNKAIEDIEAGLLPSAKTALDEPVW
ncbi:hypothetical protein [Neorhizobium sp. DT-125]|uniref:hypothetical protein n=1 Tax=Neorhizobium sp. DT-125 TaxID=3396163 RepID=UPI003F1ADA4C